jgi:hypothetical protein
MTEFFQGMGTLCPRWLPASFERRGVKAGRTATAQAARSGLYALERNHAWNWFEFEANAKTFKPWTAGFSGCCSAAQWKGKLGIVAALRFVRASDHVYVS